MSRLLAYRPANAPHRQGRWARGLIHFHTRFSAGRATVRGAAAVAPGPAGGSEAHTRAFDVAPLRGAFDWEDNENKPYDHWKDEHDQAGTLAAVLLKLRQAGPP